MGSSQILRAAEMLSLQRPPNTTHPFDFPAKLLTEKRCSSMLLYKFLYRFLYHRRSLWLLAICVFAQMHFNQNALSQNTQFERIQLSDQFYSEGGTQGDFDGDGRGDVAVGPWIYFGPSYSEKSRFYAGESVDPLGYSENFLMYTRDVNADRLPDILVLGFPGKQSWWYENPGTGAREQLWTQHVMLDSVDNESPLIADIDGDGLDDLICSSKGSYGYATHAGQQPDALWRFVPISPNNGYQRFTHGLGVGDVNNDGRPDLMEKDGWWQQPVTRNASGGGGEPWTFHAFSFSSGGSQMHAVDLDGDGRNEVVTGLAAHGPGLVYYRATNAEATQFERVDIMTDDPATSPVGLAIGQLHAVEVGDINRDGVPDILTGKRWWAHANKDATNSQPATLLWLEGKRLPDRVGFVPHVIDNSSGVGTQVTMGDVNGDGLIDIVAGIKRGAYLFLQRPSGMPASGVMVAEQQTADSFGQQPAWTTIATEDQSATFVPAIHDRRLNFGFESGDLSDWEIRGSISGGALVEAKPSQEPAGRYLVDTGSSRVDAIGELISRPFKLTHGKVRFWLSGIEDPEARVELIAEESGKAIASATAASQTELVFTEFDVTMAIGQMVRLRVVDHSSTAYLRVDDFRLGD